jgi:hypothetical protein
MLTIGKENAFIHCEQAEEATRLTPGQPVIVQSEEGGAQWYVLGEPIKQKDGWIISLQAIAQPPGIAPLRHFTATPNGILS